MRRKGRFTQVIKDDGSILVFHSRTVSHIVAVKGDGVLDLITVTLNSGQSVDVTGTLEGVMVEIYGRTLTTLVGEPFLLMASFLKRIWQRLV